MARFELADAIAIVTGGSRGIGPHIASALAARGTRIALVSRSQAQLEANARELAEAGAVVVAIAADVTSREDRHRIVDTAERELGPVDVLVNNAGGEPQRQFDDLSEREIEDVIELNLTSAVILSRLLLPGMLARERGHIVNVSSMAGRVSFPHSEPYAAAKDGLIGFTRVLRGDYRRRGVSASTLILGPIRGAGVGARTTEEIGLDPPPFGATASTVGAAAVRAIVKDKPELVVMPGPGRTLRSILDRFPDAGPRINRISGVERTMVTVAEFREREAQVASDRMPEAGTPAA
jgi:short-subunit dehydrogenase